MRLSKKNQARQGAISRAIASGRALGGLLAGIAATMFTGCDSSPRMPMGDYPNPDPDVHTNAASERHSRSSRMGKYLIDEPKQPNEVNEKKKVFVTDGYIAKPVQEAPKADEAKP